MYNFNQELINWTRSNKTVTRSYTKEYFTKETFYRKQAHLVCCRAKADWRGPIKKKGSKRFIGRRDSRVESEHGRCQTAARQCQHWQSRGLEVEGVHT